MLSESRQALEERTRFFDSEKEGLEVKIKTLQEELSQVTTNCEQETNKRIKLQVLKS